MGPQSAIGGPCVRPDFGARINGAELHLSSQHLGGSSEVFQEQTSLQARQISIFLTHTVRTCVHTYVLLAHLRRQLAALLLLIAILIENHLLPNSIGPQILRFFVK